MKKSSLILAIIFLSALFSYNSVSAQEKSKEEKEKEMQEKIDAQKKEMIEQKKMQEEIQKALENSRGEVEKAMQEFQEQMKENPEQLENIYRIYNDRGRSRVYIPNTGDPLILGYGHFLGGDGERTTWDFSKNVKESTFTREYIFDVEPTVKSVMMSVNGDCKEGEIRIKIIMPNNKIYSDIVIDEFGNLNWRKSFSISETENKDKTGPWKFEINSTKASGFFKISLQTY